MAHLRADKDKNQSESMLLCFNPAIMHKQGSEESLLVLCSNMELYDGRSLSSMGQIVTRIT